MKELTVAVSDKVFDMIVQCAHSGLYGDGMDDTVLALLRPGFAEAVRIGVVKL